MQEVQEAGIVDLVERHQEIEQARFPIGCVRGARHEESRGSNLPSPLRVYYAGMEALARQGAECFQ